MPVEVILRNIGYDGDMRAQAGQGFELKRGNFNYRVVVESEVFHFFDKRVSVVPAGNAVVARGV